MRFTYRFSVIVSIGNRQGGSLNILTFKDKCNGIPNINKYVDKIKKVGSIFCLSHVGTVSHTSIHHLY